MKQGIDYVGVGVGALIFDKHGKFFMTLRGPQAKNERGTWEIPGGSVEFGETLEHAIQREVFEEYGIHIQVKELLHICDHIIPEEHQHWVSPTYICEITKGTPTIKEPEKCSAMGWFSIKEAEKLPLSIVTKYDIEKLKEGDRILPKFSQ